MQTTLSLEERVKRLEDQLNNGIKWDRKRNIYYLVWTKRQLAIARREAKKLFRNIKVD